MWFKKQRLEGSNRIVEIYKDRVYKIPKDYEAVLQNRAEAYIWDSTKHPYLCECKLVDDIFIDMQKVDDISQNVEGVLVDWLPNDFKELLIKHPKLEYGVLDGVPKIYDYADCEYDWDRENPEDMFIYDLNLCCALNGV
jgi:DNA-binding ferritin-like protein (Dps family)